MDTKTEDFICLKDIVAEISLWDLSQYKNEITGIKQPAQSILDNPKSLQHFRSAVAISTAAQVLGLHLGNEESNYRESVSLSDRSRMWEDVDAVIKIENQSELVAEVLFLLNLLGRWADRVSSSQLPLVSLDQVVSLARKRDQIRLEKIGLLRRAAESLVKTFVSRWSRRALLERKMFANADAPPPTPLDSNGISSTGKEAFQGSSISTSSLLSPSVEPKQNSTHFGQLQPSAGLPPSIPAPSPLGITGLLVQIARNFCTDRQTEMSEVADHVVETLYRQFKTNAFFFPFQGMNGNEEFVFIEKGRSKPLTAEKIRDRLRKNQELKILIESSKNFQRKIAEK